MSPNTTSYTLTDGITKVQSVPFVVRVLNDHTFIRFDSTITGVTVVKSTTTDNNPNADYYNITIPNNPLSIARRVIVYGYSSISSYTPFSGTVILDVYQSGV